MGQKKAPLAQAAPEKGTNGMKPSSKGNDTNKESGKTIVTKGLPIVIAVAATVTVALLGVHYLITLNSDVLFTAQSLSFFTSDRSFIDTCMHYPGDFISWVAAFLTQFFYHPALGSGIIIALWILSMWLSKYAFKVKAVWMGVLAIPVLCLLVSTIDTGYWIYYIKQTGYFFYGTVGYLFSMLLTLFFSFFKKKTDRIIVMALIVATYPFLGWYALLTLLYICLLSISRIKADDSLFSKIVIPAVPLVLIGIIPLLCYNLYTSIRIEDMWTVGLYIFADSPIVTFSRTVPFIIMAAVPLVFPFLSKLDQGKRDLAWCGAVISIAALVGSYMWLEKRNFTDHNYQAAMRMYKAMDEQDWDKALNEMASLPGDAPREMVIMKNVALLNKGTIGNEMFKYNNMGKMPENDFDTLFVHMVQTAAPLIYYYHGKTNFSTRWSIENSVEYGYSYRNLKNLARCALIDGEMEMAKRYLTILQNTLYYRAWAEHLLPITENPELIKKYPEFDSVRELRDNMGTALDGDDGLCEMYLINYFSHTMNKDSKLLQEYTLAYALIQKDIQLFWQRFMLYAQLHSGEPMPDHYQEAALLYGSLEPESMDISSMPFRPEVRESYQGFQQMSHQLLASGMDAKAVGEAMKVSYGHTFYWFYFFCRDIHSY